MEKDKKNYGKSILVVLLLLITMVALVFATYAWARYTSTATGNVQASIARWDVTLSSSDSKFVRQYEHVVTGKMAPGTEGEITIALNANDTDVNFDFEVSMSDVSTMQKPAHVRFYRTRTGSENAYTYADEIVDASSKIIGRVIVVDPTSGQKIAPRVAISTDGTAIPAITASNLNSATQPLDSTNGNLSIYWNWAYDYASYGINPAKANYTPLTDGAEGSEAHTNYLAAVEAYDTQDTTDARDFNPTVSKYQNGEVAYDGNNVAIMNNAAKTMVVNFTLTATQTRPTPTTYTTPAQNP